MGSTNRADHYNWAQGKNEKGLEDNILLKIEMLFECASVNDDQFANLYADILYMGETYFFAKNDCHWNSSAGSRDDYYRVAKESKRERLLSSFYHFVQIWFKCLDIAKQKTLFADLSVPIASVSPTDSANKSAAKMKPKDGENIQFIVTVVNEKNEPVAGAQVYGRDNRKDTSNPFSINSGTVVTDVYGKAYLLFDRPGTYIFEVTHPDYQMADKYIPTTQNEIPVSITLKTKGKKVINVTLTAQDNGLAVEGARIYLTGNENLSATTDGAGNASIPITEGNIFEVEIFHSQFKTYITTLRLSDDQTQYSLTHQLKRKSGYGDEKEVEDDRMLTVVVFGRDENGNTLPVANAKVTLKEGLSKNTDSYGKVEIIGKFALGEKMEVKIEKDGYKSFSTPFTVSETDSLNTIQVVLEAISQNAEGWLGTWLGMEKRLVYTFQNDDKNLSGSYRVDLTGAYHANGKGSGNLSNCTVKKSRPDCSNCDEEEARCNWTGNYQADNFPLTNYTGIAKLYRKGKTLVVGFYTLDEKGKENYLDKHDLERPKY
jgi:hypothetical protein